MNTKRCILLFSTGAVTGLLISDVIDRLKTRLSRDVEKNSYLNFTKFGLPSTNNLEYYKQYITSIDYARRIPSWVGYSLSRSSLVDRLDQPISARSRSEFQSECQTVPKQFLATNEDYYDSGWSRGHMAPAGDHKYSDQQAMDETFLLSANIVPQDLDNNGNYWYRIGWFARELVKKFDFVHIITGPLFIPVKRKPSNDQDDPTVVKELSNFVIGRNEVHVPTHLFKCILVENENKHELALGCFVVPNEPIDRDRPLTDFAVPVEDIERRSGLNFFRRMVDLNRVPFLCNRTSCELTGRETMPREVVEQIDYIRKVRRCKALDQLNNLWTEIGNKQYKKLHKYLNDAYAKQLSELNQPVAPSANKIE